VAKYNNNITNGNHQALKMALDSAGNICVLGVSANSNTNTGYVVVKYAPNGNQLWTTRYDSTNFPAATPTGFALDNSNNIIVTGNAVTARYDANGRLLWTAPYGGTAVAVDPGENAYITGVASNFTTTKLSPSGSNIWTATATFEGYANFSQGIAIDSMTNVYVAGSETYFSDRGLSYVRLAAIKYGAKGNLLWGWNDEAVEGSDQFLYLAGLVLDSSQNAFIEVGSSLWGGYETFKINSDGTPGGENGNPTDDGFSLSHDMVIDNIGNILVTGGNDYDYPNNMYGTYKIDTNGNYLWGKTYSPVVTGNSVATSIAVDQADSAYVTGFSPSLGTNGDSDIVTIKYDTNGNQVWLQRYNDSSHGNDAGNAIAVDNSGNVYVAGYETETNGFTSMILIKYSPVTLESQSNGNVILHANGSPGETFDIQASTNLQTWQDLGRIIADTNGVVSFNDTNALLFPARFYYTLPQ
jgi:hypothetical protein